MPVFFSQMNGLVAVVPRESASILPETMEDSLCTSLAGPGPEVRISSTLTEKDSHRNIYTELKFIDLGSDFNVRKRIGFQILDRSIVDQSLTGKKMSIIIDFLLNCEDKVQTRVDDLNLRIRIRPECENGAHARGSG